MYIPVHSVVFAAVLSSLLLVGCSPSGPKSRAAIPSAGTGALVDGEATNAVGDGDVISEPSGINSQIGEALEGERRYEYRSGR